MSLIQSSINLHLSFIYSLFLCTWVRSCCFSPYCLHMKAETAAFSSLYSHGSHTPMAQASTTHDRKRASAGISLCPRVLSWIILRTGLFSDRMVGVFSWNPQTTFHWMCTFERLLISVWAEFSQGTTPSLLSWLPCRRNTVVSELLN